MLYISEFLRHGVPCDSEFVFAGSEREAETKQSHTHAVHFMTFEFKFTSRQLPARCLNAKQMPIQGIIW